MIMTEEEKLGKLVSINKDLWEEIMTKIPELAQNVFNLGHTIRLLKDILEDLTNQNKELKIENAALTKLIFDVKK